MAANVPPSLLPAYQAASAATGVPVGILEAQDQLESGFNPGAVSPGGAQGIAQFLPGTARSVGLSNPFDPVASIMAQARYDAQLFAQAGGNWVQALTRYSGGADPAQYADRILQAAGQLPGQLLGAAASPGSAPTIGQAITGAVTATGHGLADAAGAGVQNVASWLHNFLPGLVVALVVALVLFGGGGRR